MSTAEIPFRWKSIAIPALLPTLLFSIGEGAIIPIIPIVAGNLGATLAIAGFVAAILTVGELIGDIPSGWLVARVGERPAMIGATLLSVIGLVICVLAPNPWALAFGVFLIGLATAVFALARHAFMTSFVPVAYRARALSTLGGIFRAGFFIGPFITAAAIHLTGTATSAFWIHIACCLAAALLLVTLRDPTATFGVTRVVGSPVAAREGEAFIESESKGLFQTLYDNRAVLTKLGSGAALIGAMRASRALILPLWAVSIGISETNTALIIGIAAGIDFALFYTSGQIMDRFGRLWSAVPSMVGLGIGHLVLALTHDVPDNVAWFVSAAMFMSLANGIGSGILMTLGADLADKDNPAPFLGAWRFTGSLGSAGAPLAVSAVTGLASIALASGLMAVLGLIGAGILLRYVPRYAPHVPRHLR
ncbi:MAG: transporter [Microbacteriaceae bacterium]|jgi:MFS family permease|nr:transporter [Microbacteriaceae bacterium]